jgi:hypothetical protein
MTLLDPQQVFNVQILLILLFKPYFIKNDKKYITFKIKELECISLKE